MHEQAYICLCLSTHVMHNLPLSTTPCTRKAQCNVEAALAARTSSNTRGFFRIALAHATRCFSPARRALLLQQLLHFPTHSQSACIRSKKTATSRTHSRTFTQQICTYLHIYSQAKHPFLLTTADGLLKAGYAQARLTAAQPQAALADYGVVLLREAVDDGVVQRRGACRIIHLLIAGLWPPIPAIPDTALEVSWKN